jgi:hypothetical protein
MGRWEDGKMNIEHRTSNIERRTLKGKATETPERGRTGRWKWECGMNKAEHIGHGVKN